MEINKHINNKTVEVTGGVQNSPPPTRTRTRTDTDQEWQAGQHEPELQPAKREHEQQQRNHRKDAPRVRPVCVCAGHHLHFIYPFRLLPSVSRSVAYTCAPRVCVCRASALCVRASIFRETKTGENINSKETASGNEGAEAPHMRACVCVERAEEGQCVGVAFIAVCIISYSPPTIPHALSHPLAEAGEVTLTPATLTGLLLAEVSLDRRLRFRLHRGGALLPVRGAHLAVLLHELKSLQQA